MDSGDPSTPTTTRAWAISASSDRERVSRRRGSPGASGLTASVVVGTGGPHTSTVARAGAPRKGRTVPVCHRLLQPGRRPPGDGGRAVTDGATRGSVPQRLAVAEDVEDHA